MHGPGALIEPVERVAARADRPAIAVLCEHASERMPPGWAWPEADRRLRGTHWAWDPGAAEVARGLAAAFGGPAVLSRFTRLLVDPNRPLDSETLFRDVADGLPVALNAQLDAAERARRVEALWRPYHDAADAMVADTPGAVVVSVHSFTDRYEGVPRTVEIGVLHDRQPALGQAVRRRLEGRYDARDNEPWDGRGGLMYSPQRHADAHGRDAIEFELRQDLLADAAWRDEAVARIAEALRASL